MNLVLTVTGITTDELWISYFAHAGSASLEDIDAWLSARTTLPILEVDLLILAVNDLAEQAGHPICIPPASAPRCRH